MRIVCGLFVGFLLCMLLTACTTTPGKERPKVYCPACGAEIDAIFQKHF